MSIGFSVFQTSGARRRAAAPSRSTTAKTTSAPPAAAAGPGRRRQREPREPPELRRQRLRGRRASAAAAPPAAPATASSTSDADDQRHAVVDATPQRRRHPHQPRHEQQAEQLGEARARRRAGARAASAASGAAARPTTSISSEEARAPRASRPARVHCRLAGMPLYDLVADLPLDDRRLRARGPARTVSLGLRAPSRRSFHLHGARRGGPRRGRDLRRRGAATPSRRAARCSPLAGEWTFDAFSAHLGDARPVPRLHARACRSTAATAAGRSRARRSTSRCARPARSLHDAARPRRRSRSRSSSPRGMGEPPTHRRRSRAGSRATRRCASSSTRTPDWTDELIDAAASRPARSTRSTSRAPTRARRSTSTTDPAFYRRDRRGVPGRLARGSRPRDRRGRAPRSRPYQDRITWDAPIHSVADILEPRR